MLYEVITNLSYSVDSLSDAFSKTQEAVNANKDELKNAYQSLVSSMDLDFSSLADGNKEYRNNFV